MPDPQFKVGGTGPERCTRRSLLGLGLVAAAGMSSCAYPVTTTVLSAHFVGLAMRPDYEKAARELPQLPPDRMRLVVYRPDFLTGAAVNVDLVVDGYWLSDSRIRPHGEDIGAVPAGCAAVFDFDASATKVWAVLAGKEDRGHPIQLDPARSRNNYARLRWAIDKEPLAAATPVTGSEDLGGLHSNQFVSYERLELVPEAEAVATLRGLKFAGYFPWPRPET